MGNPVVHFELIGKDAAALQKFYGDLFGWSVDANNPMNYGVVDTGEGRGINGGIGGGEQASSAFYVEVDDPQAYLARVEAAGGKTTMPVTVVPGMVTFAQFADPEGNVVGLVKSEES
ncbi:MAG: glyoxalase [Chloroflexi bacterium]|nr:glyoxalase [Chloroflexota bacterium]